MDARARTPGDDTPYCRDVPVNPATGYAASDAIVMDEVLRSVREGVPADGAVKRPNLSFVNFPQIDSAGHATGTGAAYEAAIGIADDELRRFADQQRSLGLWGRTVMLVVSDHSMDTTPTGLAGPPVPRGGLSSDDYLIVQNGSVDMVYLKDRGRADRDAVLARMRAAALPAADEALYRVPNAADGGAAHTLAAVHPGWRIAGERTGDLFVTRGAGAAWSDPANPLTGNHGGPQTTDNTFAVISGGDLVRQQAVGGVVGPRFDDTLANPGSAQNVDVAPTVLALLGRGAPGRQRGAGARARRSRRACCPVVGSRRGPAGVRRPARAFAVVACAPGAGRGLRIGFRAGGAGGACRSSSCGPPAGGGSSRGWWRASRGGRGLRVAGARSGAGDFVVRFRVRDAAG